MQFTPENRDRFDRIVARYPTRRAAMLPALWLVQEQEGWISAEGMEYVAGLLEVSPAEVQAVVSFYTMYDRRPPGRYNLQVCRTLSCALMGAYDVLRHLEARLGIHNGETTGDGLFTLQEVECLGSCGTGPMMQVNERFYENLTLERVDRLLDWLRNDRPELEATPEVYGLAEVQAAVPRAVSSLPADVGGAAAATRETGPEATSAREMPGHLTGREPARDLTGGERVPAPREPGGERGPGGDGRTHG